MGEPVRPVGQLLVGSPAPVADQRGMVAKSLCDHGIRLLDGGVEMVRVVEAFETEFRPFFRWRQMVACERIDVRSRSKHMAAVPLFSFCPLSRHFQSRLKFWSSRGALPCEQTPSLAASSSMGACRRQGDSSDRDGHSETSTSRLNMGQHRTSPKLFQA
jgi:hypothetical protein